MDIEEAKTLVIQAIASVMGDSVQVGDDTRLIGSENHIPAMKHVEFCQRLEGMAVERGFHFDWTSEAVLAKSHTMFSNVTYLANEFLMQSLD